MTDSFVNPPKLGQNGINNTDAELDAVRTIEAKQEFRTIATVQSPSTAKDFLAWSLPVNIPSLISIHGAHSPYLPAQPHAQAASCESYVDLTPVSASDGDLGGVSRFEYRANDHDILKSAQICVKLCRLNIDNLASSTANPAGCRWPDDPIPAMLDRVEMLYSGNLIWRRTGTQMHFANVRELKDLEKRRRRPLQGWGYDDAERKIAAQNSRYYLFDLPVWFAGDHTRHFHQYAFRKSIEFVFYWKPAANVIQINEDATGTPVVLTDLGAAASAGAKWIVSQHMRFTVAAVTEATKAEFMTKLKSAAGISMMEDDVVILSRNAFEGSMKTGDINLKSCRKYAYNIGIICRDQRNLVADYTRNNPWALLPIGGLKFTVGGQEKLPKTDEAWLRYEVNAKKFSNEDFTCMILNIPLCELPQVHYHSTGGLEMANIQDPIVTWYGPLTAKSVTATATNRYAFDEGAINQTVFTSGNEDYENVEFDVFIDTHNFIQLYMTADGQTAIKTALRL